MTWFIVLFALLCNHQKLVRKCLSESSHANQKIEMKWFIVLFALLCNHQNLLRKCLSEWSHASSDEGLTLYLKGKLGSLPNSLFLTILIKSTHWCIAYAKAQRECANGDENLCCKVVLVESKFSAFLARWTRCLDFLV